MASQRDADLLQRLTAVERLLTTLIAFLASRDPHLLEELQAVFDKPDFDADTAGRSAAETWARISQSLSETRAVLGSLAPPSQAG